MATKKTTAPETVSKKEFDNFKEEITEGFSALTELIKSQKPISSEAVTEMEKEVAKADPDFIPVNPEWDKAARTIIGEDVVDHCETKHLKNGGILFTVVIKDEHSNAPKDYLARYKQDRRTREIGNEGYGGVELWCKLIKQNLARPR